MAKITYENKVALNVNSDIADINKVNASDLNEIKNVVNSNDDMVGDLTQLNTTNKSSMVNAINEVNTNDIRRSTYSTDEQVIGKWINGKPLYRKVLNVGTVAEQKSYITHNIANLGKLVNLYGTCNRNDNVQQIMPANYTNWEIYLYDISSIEISIYFSANQWNKSPYDIVVIMEYTKTTD